MTAIQGIATVWLPVSDMQAAVEFYSGTLGLSIEQQQDEWSELKTDHLRVGLNRRESPSGDGGAVIAFHAEDLEAAVDELKGKGVTFTGDVSEHSWGRIAPFQDPDGNDLQLYSPPQ